MIAMSDLRAGYRRLTLPYFLPLALVIFTASGFAGLIYESIWSHYVKLFLGHAAYAQTLVLAIYMGGMALGAWLASRWSQRWKDLLVAYAVIEALVGAASLVFHDVFVAATAFAFDSAIPALGSPLAIHAFKWTLATLLILPQSVLLGMTFPLMTGGVLRIRPERSGYAVAMLYFTNSLGAAVGVLASGFYLIEAAGLPGTLAAAASVNLLVAVAAMLLPRGAARLPPATAAQAAAPAPVPRHRLLLAVAALTGLSSFMYEIGWIRMLSLVLGSSTHAFELMLSAFILGIAFGGLWIRRRIDAATDAVRLLGIVQVVMGLAAIATLPVYASSFHVMRAALNLVVHTEQGYVVFNFLSHAICLAVMFPAAFCAGMTLPLITVALMRAGAGERAIGQVYAANTFGAIAGVLFAVHVGLPLLGLKGLIVAGAAVDLVLGAVLLGAVAGRLRSRGVAVACAVSVAAVAVALFGVRLDAHLMNSGVFRTGVIMNPARDKVLVHLDGKTATVSITSDGAVSALRTNGKSDGALRVVDGDPVEDEMTMTLMGALPQFLAPEARRVANIGFGTGMTASVLLASKHLESVDTVEIEPAIVEASSRHLRSRNARAFSDPRHRIFYEDAKTHFSSQPARYDVIISEPSNPWVSGVASLFTTEFYRDVRRYLKPDGLFLQWVQVYEMSPVLLATVVAALDENFADYEVWMANSGDMVFVATNRGEVPQVHESAFESEELRADLARFHIRNVDDLLLHRIGRRATLAPYFRAFGAEPNSDYFPILDLNAARARFMRITAFEIPGLASAALPLLEMFDPARPQRARPAEYTPGDRPWWRRAEWIEQSRRVRDFLRSGDTRVLERVSPELAVDLVALRAALLVKCDLMMPSAPLQTQLVNLARYVSAQLPLEERKGLWSVFTRSPCVARLAEADRRWLRLHAAVGDADSAAMTRESAAILEKQEGLGGNLLAFALAANMAGNNLQGDRAAAMRSFTKYRNRLSASERNQWEAVFRFLAGHAGGEVPRASRPPSPAQNGQAETKKGNARVEGSPGM